MTVVSYRRSTKVSYRDFVFNYHDDVEGCASLLKEEKNHNLESIMLSPSAPEAEDICNVKSNEQVLSLENNLKKSAEIDKATSSKNIESSGGDDDKVKAATEEDPLIDLEVKPTSKKKKNKKNQKEKEKEWF